MVGRSCRFIVVHLAFSPTTAGLDLLDLAGLTVTAERLGYGSAWLAEVAGPEAFAMAGAIAARTEHIDIGVAVVPAATRSAAVLAMSAATISGLAPGRTVSLGIGSSSRVIVERWHGAGFDPPATRVRETVLAVRALLSAERSYAGETVKVSGFRLGIPLCGPVRLLVGALGPGMLRIAGAVADGVCLNLMPPSAVVKQLAEVRAGAEAGGRTLPDDFEVVARLFLVPCDDPIEGRGMVRRVFGPMFAQPVYNRFLTWCGYPDEAAAISSAFGAGDRAGVDAALHDGLIDEIALIGSVGRIRERLGAFEAAGIRTAALAINAPTASAVAATLEGLATG